MTPNLLHSRISYELNDGNIKLNRRYHLEVMNKTLFFFHISTHFEVEQPQRAKDMGKVPSSQ